MNLTKSNNIYIKEVQESACFEDFIKKIGEERGRIRNILSKKIANAAHLVKDTKTAMKQCRKDNKNLIKRIKQSEDFTKGKSINDLRCFYNQNHK